MIGLALRTLARYLVPLVLATAVVLAPIAHVVFHLPFPRDLATANAALRFGFVIAATGFIWTLFLVGAAAPLARSIAAGAPLSQLRAVPAAFGNLVRMAVPCAAAIAAIVVGALALVVPALVLLVLFAMTGASTERGMPAPLLEAARAARDQLRTTIVVVGVMLVLDIAIAIVGWKVFAVPFGKKLTPAQWATFGNVGRVVVIGLAATSPIFATLLAALKAKR